MSEGRRTIPDARSKGKEFILVGVDEASDDALISTPCLLGSISPMPSEEEQQYNRLNQIDEAAILLAYRHFQKHLGRAFHGTISCDLGGSNTACAFYAAAVHGGSINDADPAGRAVPEITHWRCESFVVR